MGRGQQLDVDLGVLRGSTQALRDVRMSMDKAVANLQPPTLAATGALPGWHTARALGDLLAWWGDDLGTFGVHLGETADAMAACVRDYEAGAEASEQYFWPLVYH